jgi:SAM-dependent methyltransferase
VVLKREVVRILRSLGWGLVRAPQKEFHNPPYLRHNARRLEHLASLRIPVSGLSVLELGAGIGDHSHYYLDRGCQVTITEARKENLSLLRRLYPKADIRHLDMENPNLDSDARFDLVHCYGLLYHLSNPQQAIDFIARHCAKLLFLETCVTIGDAVATNPVREDRHLITQALSGTGCRPTRAWVFRALKDRFEHVYVPRTQPNHEEFAIDWSAPDQRGVISRAVFTCSREPLRNEMLSAELLDKQTRHE